ncbi:MULTISPECIES: restriction endonuclease subunit S [Vibrio harveyi group]|uniref:restriction endonuclease subunit S n=1 Tax=Vibrio harveyi group TaxID=717610 RepID=UPI001EFEC63A|nr:MULTISPECIES: restriction endonuclease subunit S [Vibrio harveyi group]MCG9762369.1 restriction endonuclease subunit S [Vibrio alginolyticus]MCS0323025.1 restriction endonuclease subunit S [Vibrio diabolicus]
MMKNLSLPNSWASCEIEDILEAQSDGKLIHQGWSPQCEKEPAGLDDWGVLKTTAIQDGFFLDHENKRLPESKEPKTRIEVKNGDLLVTNAGPRSRCGVICFVRSTRNKLMISGKMYRLRFPESLICPEYIESWLRTSFAQKALNDRKTGISESGLNMTQAKFKTLPVVVAPFAEQKAITEKLNTLLAKVEATKARLESTIETLKQFRQSVLEMAMKGHFIDRKEPTLKHINELVSEPLKNGKSVKDGDGPRVLRLTALKNQVVDLGEFKNGMWTAALASKFFVQEGDILVSRGNGSLNLLARGSVVKDVRIDTAYPDTMIRIRLDKNKISSSFFLLAWSSQVVREQIQLSAKTTAGIWKVSQKDLSTISVPYFSISEQTEIVRRVEKLFAGADATEQQVNQALERVNNLTQSILAKAFRGELTEQWRKENPELISGDNSAEALLKKIKAERAATKPKRKARTTSA